MSQEKKIENMSLNDFRLSVKTLQSAYEEIEDCTYAFKKLYKKISFFTRSCDSDNRVSQEECELLKKDLIQKLSSYSPPDNCFKIFDSTRSIQERRYKHAHDPLNDGDQIESVSSISLTNSGNKD